MFESDYTQIDQTTLLPKNITDPTTQGMTNPQQSQRTRQHKEQIALQQKHAKRTLQYRRVHEQHSQEDATQVVASSISLITL
jgi:uncharacterized protein YkwD